MWKSRVENDCQFSTTRSHISCGKADARRSSYLPQRVSQVRPVRTELQRKLKEKHQVQQEYNKNVVQEGWQDSQSRYESSGPKEKQLARYSLSVRSRAFDVDYGGKYARFPFTVQISYEKTEKKLA